MRASSFARAAAAAALAFASQTFAAVPTIVSGTDYALALSKDGKVYAWGWDTHGQLGSGRTVFQAVPLRVAGVPPIVWIDGGTSHVAAVDWLGKVWTWGSDDAGQLGRRSTSDPMRPGQVRDVANVVRVTASKTFTAALKSDGTVVVWGTFAGRQRAPEPIAGMANIVDIRSGFGHVLALRADGAVLAAGSNDYGELGDGTSGTTHETAQFVPNLAGIVKIGAGPCGSMAVRNDGTVVAWGRAACSTTAARYSPTPVASLANVADVVGGVDHSHAVLKDGSVRVWDNAYTPTTRTGFLAVTQIAADTQLETLALLANDTVIVSGNNDYGQHGQGNTDPISGISLTSLSDIVQVATAHVGDGSVTHYARGSNGELYAWGAGLVGQLGAGGSLVTSVPALVSGLPEIVKVAAGDTSAYAVDINGAVWGWGDNAGYALGDGTATPRSKPVKVAALAGVKDVAAGRGFALFVMADGTVQKVGDILAPGLNVAPAAVAGLANIATVAARGSNAYAISTTGAVMAWGRGTDGMVGDGTTTDRSAPVAIAAFNKPVTSVSAGARHVLALTNDGAAWSWGTDDGSGTLGDAISTSHTVPAPAPIVGIANVSAVAAGATHSIALLATGLVDSWGTTALAAGSTDTRHVPGPVTGVDSVAAVAAGRNAAWAVDTQGIAYTWGGVFARGGPGGFGATTGDGTFVYRDHPAYVLRDGAQGSLDTSDAFLDLDSTAIPANPVVRNLPPLPSFIPVAQGTIATHSVSVDAGIHFRAADSGRNAGTYIVGYVPPAFLAQPPVSSAIQQDRVQALVSVSAPIMVQLTSAGWTTVDGLLVPYSQGTLNGNSALESALNGVDPSAIPGARFCIGYGEDGGTMLAKGAIAQVIAIEPAAAAPSPLPCVVPGVYLDGVRESSVTTTVAFTATVVGSAPTGTVRFSNGFVPSTTSIPLVSTSPSTARAMVTFDGLGLGRHAIGATYSGDSGNPVSSAGLPLLHLVRTAPVIASAVDVTFSGPPSSTVGSEVTFTVTVLGKQPTGTVQFREVNTALGPPAPLINGVATLRISSLPAGVHQLNAVYSGDSANTGRPSNNWDFTVFTTPGPGVSLSVSPPFPQIGTPVTISATVEGAPSVGTIQFFDRGAPISDALDAVAGKAAITIDKLASGRHLLTALYARDPGNRWVSGTTAADVALAIDPAYPNSDADGDGIPNSVEKDVGRNPFAMDNDVFGDARLFTMQMYRDYLGREGDATGINYWTSQLAAGAMQRSQVTESFFFSPEFQGSVGPVARLYFAYFLRIPDYGGLTYWIGQYRTGTPLQSISDFFANSSEFRIRYGSLNNGSFVQLVYSNVLGRQPDNGGYSFWLGQLNVGAMSRGALMTGFSESPEYTGLSAHEVYVTMMYIGMLRRVPDPSGFSFWVNQLDVGNTGRTLIDGFIASPEYRSRFLP